MLDNLPNTPLSKDKLASTCKPVYCSYNFCGNKHNTHEKHHTKKTRLVFDDVKVYLAGTMDINSIIEQFQVNQFEFQIHDRDQRTDQDLPIGSKHDKNRPLLFGEDPLDLNFGKNHASRLLSPGNSSTGVLDTTQNAHGIARLSLKPLLEKGVTAVSEIIPVVPSSTKSSAGIPAGHYLQADTELNVEVTVQVPLIKSNDIESHKKARPYQLVGFVFDNNDIGTCEFISKLKNLVTTDSLIILTFYQTKILKIKICQISKLSSIHNKSHFDTTDLSTIPLTYQLPENKDKHDSPEWISGFHLYDTKYHAIVLESHHSTLESIILSKILPSVYSLKGCEVLFDSSLLFIERRFLHNPILYTTRLHKTTQSILGNPKMYIEEHKTLIQSILTFWNLRTCRTMREAMKTNCIPTVEQLLLLEKSMAVPVYNDNFLFNHKKHSNSANSSTGHNCTSDTIPERKPRFWTPLDHKNPEFVKSKKTHPRVRLIHKNRKQVSDMSSVVNQHNQDKLKTNRPYTTHFDDTEMQRFLRVSRRLEKENTMDRLKNIYNRDSSHGRSDKIEQEERPRFTPFGHKTVQESNRHIKKPGEDRCEELHRSWVENTLHAAKLKPTLEDRDVVDGEGMKLYGPRWQKFKKKQFFSQKNLFVNALSSLKWTCSTHHARSV